MSIYFPNIGEREIMRADLNSMQLILGLHKNVVTPDGSLSMLNIEEMPSGGGRGYAAKVLSMDFALSATADKWYLSTNAAGKAEAKYSDDYLEWEFNAMDVADSNTVYGVHAFTYVVPFDAGSDEIKVGDLVAGATSGAYGTVTGVVVTSGTWGASTAAGYVFVKSKSGTFQNDENLIIKGKIATVAVNAGGTGYAVGDILGVTQTGSTGAKLVVSTVNAGVVTGVVVVEGGQGHAVDTGLATTAITGGGTGCTIDISTLSTTAKAVSNTGTLFNGDAHKQIIFIESLPTAQVIDVSGRKIKVLVTWTLKSE